MPRNDGLPPDGLPQPRPSPPPSAPRADLAPGTVGLYLGAELAGTGRPAASWSGALSAVAQQPPALTYTPFHPKDDPLRGIQSIVEQSVSGDDSTLAGTAKDIFGPLVTALGHPVSSIVDQVEVGKIRDLQQQFLANHEGELRRLGEDQATAKGAMRRLADLLDDFKKKSYPADVDKIMDEKKYAGAHALAEINNALDQTTDPAERKRLQALKDDLLKWMDDRDKRIAAEQEEVRALEYRLQLLRHAADQQADVLRAAADSQGPDNRYAYPDPNGPEQIVATSHESPAALSHIASLRNLLLRSRLDLSGALSRPLR